MYTHEIFVNNNNILLIKVSSFLGVLLKQLPPLFPQKNLDGTTSWDVVPATYPLCMH